MPEGRAIRMSRRRRLQTMLQSRWSQLCHLYTRSGDVIWDGNGQTYIHDRLWAVGFKSVLCAVSCRVMSRHVGCCTEVHVGYVMICQICGVLSDAQKGPVGSADCLVRNIMLLWRNSGKQSESLVRCFCTKTGPLKFPICARSLPQVDVLFARTSCSTSTLLANREAGGRRACGLARDVVLPAKTLAVTGHSRTVPRHVQARNGGSPSTQGKLFRYHWCPS